ncbi:hypothetical protein Mame01_53650 [Microbispora amethystogenes]|nr:hypothetical protein Mame01_53650 [Microbispora amethystogenes]
MDRLPARTGPNLSLAVLALLAVALIRLGVRADDVRLIMADLTTVLAMYVLHQRSPGKKG